MNRLPASVRRRLIQRASTSESSSGIGGLGYDSNDNSYSDSKRKEWCLRSLATINERYYGADVTTTNGKPSSRVADTLLTEVNIRLASQHKKCLDMIEQVNDSGKGGDASKSVQVPIETKTGGRSVMKVDGASTLEKKRTIRAVNNPVQNDMRSWRDFMKTHEMCQEGRARVLKNLNDLEILHADTFALTDHLLSNDKPTLRRFSKADENLIAATFEQIRSRHASTVENMADIVIEIRNIRKIVAGTPIVDINYNGFNRSSGDLVSTIDDTLMDSFLKDRLGIQLLCDHYVALDKGKPGGGVAVDCPLNDVIAEASVEAKHVCDANYGIAPEVHVHYIHSEVGNGNDSGDNGNDDEKVYVTLIRPWVHHTLVELFKNAMQSSIQKGGNNFPPPDVHVVVRKVQANDCRQENQQYQYVTCEIIDQGVGLSELRNLDGSGQQGMGEVEEEAAFEFARSSSQQRWDRLDEQQSYAMVRAPIASLGVGLTLSRMMMNMFGGTIYLKSNKLRCDDFRSISMKHLRLNSKSGCTATLFLPFCANIKEWDWLPLQRIR